MVIARPSMRFIWPPILAIATIVVVVWLGSIGPTRIAQPGAPVADGPMIAFELVRTPDQLSAVIGRPGDPATQALRDAFDRENRWDFLFMATYGLFLFSLLRAAGPADSRRWLIFAIAAPVICAGADVLENLTLFAMTAGEGEAAALITRLEIFTWIKWLGLGIATAAAGLALARGRGSRIVGLLGFVAGITALGACVGGFLMPVKLGADMSAALAAAWLLLTFLVVVRGLGPRTPGPAIIPD